MRGAGVTATRTRLTRADLNERGHLDELRELIQETGLLMAGTYHRELSPTAQVRVAELEQAAGQDVDPDRFSGTWRHQLGTLGSGNHFIELCLDEARSGPTSATCAGRRRSRRRTGPSWSRSSTCCTPGPR